MSVKQSYQSQEWFEKVETSESDWQLLWTEKEDRNGCPAYCISDPHQKAWVKPRRGKPDEAVKEKVGADLAHVLGLPVASVLLCKARIPTGQVFPVAISKYALSEHHLSWFRLQLIKNEAAVISEVNRYFQDHPAITAGMWVFDSWIRNRDRTDRNIMVSYTEGRLDSVYFYDFDKSMNWKDSLHFSKVSVHGTSDSIIHHVKFEHCMAFIAKIQSLPEQSIFHIVNRIDDFYLPKDEKKTYMEALLYHRQQLRSVFTSFFSYFEGEDSKRLQDSSWPDIKNFILNKEREQRKDENRVFKNIGKQAGD